nr:VirK/YbjX family protein [Scandinavium hiltneri]
MSLNAELSYSEQLNPKTGWQLFRLLSSGQLMPGLAWKNPAYRRKFMLRSLATPFSTAALLSRLAQQPQLLDMLHVQPGLPCRSHRPWLSMNMPRKPMEEIASKKRSEYRRRYELLDGLQMQTAGVCQR